MRKLSTLGMVFLLLVAGCASMENEEVVKTVLYMTAEEVGIYVGSNNPEFIDVAMPYYETMQSVYEDGDYMGMVGMGLVYILNDSGMTKQDALRLESKLKKMAVLLGLNDNTIPGMENIKALDKGTVKEAVDGFMNGLRIANS
jgi:hypothetical protein